MYKAFIRNNSISKSIQTDGHKLLVSIKKLKKTPYFIIILLLFQKKLLILS